MGKHLRLQTETMPLMMLITSLLGSQTILALVIYTLIQMLCVNGRVASGNIIVTFLHGIIGREQIDGTAIAIYGNWENLHLTI